MLLDRVHELVARERSCTAQLVAHLSEVELRRLYLGRGCSSMFTYCTEVLHLSEAAAYVRIEVARTIRRLPRLLDHLADGSLSLTAIRRLGAVLTSENCDRLVREARHRTSRDVDKMVAREQPKPDVPATIRQLPEEFELVSRRVRTGGSIESRGEDQARGFGDATDPAGASGSSLDSSLDPRTVRSAADRDRASIQPLAAERHRIQFTASGEMRERGSSVCRI